jgi:hypothetical protein
MNRWRRIGLSVAGVLLMAGTGVVVAQPASAVNQDGSFSLVAATGKCVEVIPDASGNFYVAGNRIQQRTCDGSPQQQWFRLSLGQFSTTDTSHPLLYHVVNRMTLQCLDDTDGGTVNRNPVQQWTCNGSTTMAWHFNGDLPFGQQVINERVTKCLDVADGSGQDGARLQIYNCFDPTGNIAQHYRIQ